jgi:hypothetical protein
MDVSVIHTGRTYFSSDFDEVFVWIPRENFFHKMLSVILIQLFLTWKKEYFTKFLHRIIMQCCARWSLWVIDGSYTKGHKIWNISYLEGILIFHPIFFSLINWIESFWYNVVRSNKSHNISKFELIFHPI